MGILHVSASIVSVTVHSLQEPGLLCEVEARGLKPVEMIKDGRWLLKAESGAVFENVILNEDW